MKKKELLKQFDDELLDKLFGFCYARTNDSYEARELCSDIIYALVKASNTDGEIANPYAFIWRVARNAYADFSDERKKRADTFYDGDADEVLQFIPADEQEDNSIEMLDTVYKRIAFLTKAYREVMIMYYIDGLSTAEIAKLQSTSENAVRQRLFSARQKIKSEVEEMTETYKRPLALDKIDYVIWGSGDPAWGDPRNTCNRMFSKQIVWLCRKKPMSASEIADELNAPTVYVEEELDILCSGLNSKYGMLRKLDNGRYAISFILFDKDTIEKATALYSEQLPKLCDIISSYIEEHKAEYLAFPYLNKKVDMNLILWQQISNISWAFSENVKRILKEKHFSDITEVSRPFSVYGYVDNGKYFGGGWDGVEAKNVCGFSNVHLDNIYFSRIKKHFHCGLNVSKDPQIQLALRVIYGLDITTLSEQEKEHAAKAIECGYLYREEDMLYTKILVSTVPDQDDLYRISNGLQNGYFDAEAELVATKVAALIKKAVPEYLLNEWRFANDLAGMPILDAVVDGLIEKGILTPPENGIGAEGCWMSVQR